MKIVDIKSLRFRQSKSFALPVFRIRRIFYEPYRKSDMSNHPQTQFLKMSTSFRATKAFQKRHYPGLHFSGVPIWQTSENASGHMVDMSWISEKVLQPSGRSFFMKWPMTPQPIQRMDLGATGLRTVTFFGGYGH